MPDPASLCAPRLDTRGPCRYFVALYTFTGMGVFVARDPVVVASSQLLRAAVALRFEILTYCFMPDRVCLLVEALDADGDAEAFVARVRQCAARDSGRRGVRWRRSAVRLLRDTAHAQAVSRDMLESPVRGGLVARPGDHPFSGSFAWDRLALLDVNAP